MKYRTLEFKIKKQRMFSDIRAGRCEPGFFISCILKMAASGVCCIFRLFLCCDLLYSERWPFSVRNAVF